MRRFRSWSFGGLVAALAVATATAAGCGSQQDASQPHPPPSIYAGLPLRGTPDERVFEQSGCAACHRIGTVGNDGPGPRLTHVGSRLSEREMRHALLRPTAPMPSFSGLSHAQVHALLAYLSRLK